MPSVLRVPKYRHHKPSGQAVVTLNGRDNLGKWGTKASRTEYDRLIGEWLASGRCLPRGDLGVSVAELALAYWRYAKDSYRKDGQPTGSLPRLRVAIRLLRTSYGEPAARGFGPLALQALRQRLAESGKSRRYVNYLVDAIKRIFRWGVSQELVPESVHRALATVAGLRKGHTGARECAPVGPVPEQVVQATLPEVVADMVRLQRLTGCRPAEVCILRPCDVDTSADVWIYRPESHKTEHHGRERVICIGPKGQDVLRPYLLREKESYCFVPAESERKRLAGRHERRRTPLSCGNRPGTNRRRRPKKRPGNRYTTGSYRRAIHRAVDLANRERSGDGLLPKWSPNRLRHSAATEIRRQFGLEAAQVALGHATADVSQIYAERDLSLAVEVMRKIG
jgi:integrase